MRLSIFDFDDYKKYIREYLRQSPRNGRGLISRWAKEARIAQAQLSQIIAGDREFTAEQSFSMSQILKHTSIEAKYLQLLVQKERAGTKEFKEFVVSQLKEIQKARVKVGNRIDHAVELTDQSRSIYFSHWLYSAIRQFCFIDGGQTQEQIINKFTLDPDFCKAILDFLLESGLCKIVSGEKYYPTSSLIKLGRESPVLHTHHSHWRLKALESYQSMSEQELMLTVPMAVSREHFILFRERLLNIATDLIRELQNVAPNEVGCLNIDFFLLRSMGDKK